MQLSARELRIVRAALMLAVHGDDAAWTALSPEDDDTAEDLLDLIPEPMTPGGDSDDEDSDDEDDEDY